MSKNKPFLAFCDDPFCENFTLKLHTFKKSLAAWEIFLGEPLSDYMARRLTSAITRERYRTGLGIIRLTIPGKI